MGRLFLLFTLVPLVELYCLFWVGRIIGPLPTIALVLVTGALGAWFARVEGFRVFQQWQQSLAKGEIPKDAVLVGIMILLGAVFLITPGIFTDIAGLSFLLPISRRWWVRLLKKLALWQIGERVVHVSNTSSKARSNDYEEEIIDVEGEVISDTETKP